jgi:hypothetical protein
MNMPADKRAERGHPATDHWVAEQMLAALTAFLAPDRS